MSNKNDDYNSLLNDMEGLGEIFDPSDNDLTNDGQEENKQQNGGNIGGDATQAEQNNEENNPILESIVDTVNSVMPGYDDKTVDNNNIQEPIQETVNGKNSVSVKNETPIINNTVPVSGPSDFGNQINSVVNDKSLEKRNALLEESRLRVEQKMNELDSAEEEKLKNDEEYQEAKKIATRSGAILASIPIALVAFPGLAIIPATVILPVVAVLLAVTVYHANKAARIAEKYKKEFETKKSLFKAQERVRNMNNPELQSLTNECINKYQPVRLNNEIESVNNTKRVAMKGANAITKMFKKNKTKPKQQTVVRENAKSKVSQKIVQKTKAQQNTVSKDDKNIANEVNNLEKVDIGKMFDDYEKKKNNEVNKDNPAKENNLNGDEKKEQPAAVKESNDKIKEEAKNEDKGVDAEAEEKPKVLNKMQDFFDKQEQEKNKQKQENQEKADDVQDLLYNTEPEQFEKKTNEKDENIVKEEPQQQENKTQREKPEINVENLAEKKKIPLFAFTENDKKDQLLKQSILAEDMGAKERPKHRNTVAEKNDNVKKNNTMQIVEIKDVEQRNTVSYSGGKNTNVQKQGVGVGA